MCCGGIDELDADPGLLVSRLAADDVGLFLLDGVFMRFTD